MSLTKIKNISFYESKCVFNSKVFQISSIFIFGMLSLYNYYYFIYCQKWPFWTLRCIPSSLPYSNLLLFGLFQPVLIFFTATNISSEQKFYNYVNTIHVRPVSNAEYVFGKALGVLAPFFLLNIVVCCIPLLYNTVFLDDVPVNINVYIYYLFILSIPSMVFSLGFFYIVTFLVRNNAISILILLGLGVCSNLFFGDRLYCLFDYYGLYTPLLYSGFVGFGNLGEIIMYRSIYFLMGSGFICLSVFLFRRLPQKQNLRYFFTLLSAICFFSVIALVTLIIGKQYSNQILRKEIVELSNKVSKLPQVSIKECTLDVLHKGKTLDVTAHLIFENTSESKVKHYYFSLNPGFKINKIVNDNNDREIEFNREHHILSIDASSFLLPGESDSLRIHYSGKIDKEACYADIEEERREPNSRFFLYLYNNCFSFITPDYVLLTYENNWYPVAGVPSNLQKSHNRDFVNFKLTVTTKKELTAISQGAVEHKDEGVYTFKPDFPLNEISLVIGDYEKRSVTVDDVSYNLFTKTGHDYFAQYFSEVGEKITDEIRAQKARFENKIEMDYPFKRLSLIEVPLQFHYYERYWTITPGTVHPEQIFLPEKGFQSVYSDFKVLHNFRSKKYTKQEIQIQGFNSFFSSMITTDSEFNKRNRVKRLRDFFELPFRLSARPVIYAEYRYCITPNYYYYIHGIQSAEYNLFNTIIEYYIYNKSQYYQGSYYALSEEVRACLALSKYNHYTEYLQNSNDIYSAQTIINLKKDQLVGFIDSGIHDFKFHKILYDYLSDNKFQNIDLNDFAKYFKECSGTDFYSVLNKWENQTGLPKFDVYDIVCFETLIDNHESYVFHFKVHNTTNNDGIIQLISHQHYRSTYPEDSDYPLEYIYLKGNRAKEINLIFQRIPSIKLNTNISLNIPNTYFIEYYLEKNKKGKISDFIIGERIIDSPDKTIFSNEIIVDNEDKNFTIINKTRKSLVKRLLIKESEEEYIEFLPHYPPSSWRLAVGINFYGQTSTAYVKKPGNGDYKAKWQIELSDNALYDIYYHVPKRKTYNLMIGNETSQHKYYGKVNMEIYNNDKLIDNINADIGESEKEWFFLGSYTFSKGKTALILTDKTDGMVVFADAVKWVKKNGSTITDEQ